MVITRVGLHLQQLCHLVFMLLHGAVIMAVIMVVIITEAITT
jgi:hypothetical protein